MLNLSQTIAYAIVALSHLPGPDSESYAQAREVSRKTGVPPAYLSKILNRLVEKHMVTGKRGHRGGFRLLRKPEEVTLLDVAGAVDPNTLEPFCILGKRECTPNANCPIHSQWDEERKRINAMLSNVTLANMSVFEDLGGCAPRLNGQALAVPASAI